MVRVFFNPLSDNKKGRKNAERIENLFKGETFEYADITKLDNTYKTITDLPQKDIAIITGGDGTLNRLANEIGGRDIPRDIYYFAAGSGNDFYKDIRTKGDNGLVLLNKYLKHLPLVEINGVKRFFLNGIGYGLDGYCCEEGDRLRAMSSKHVNYALIGLKGLLYDYKSTNAKVVVDGVERSFKDVLMAPAMHGRYFGGGIMIAPDQNRLDPENRLSLVVVHGLGKLKALPIFPSVFSGKHVKYTKYVEVICGKEITVEYDRPTPLQVDGETFVGVKGYHAAACNLVYTKKEN